MLSTINFRFFEPFEEKLFKGCLAKMPHPGNVIVQPLWRIGFSGAKVFMFFPSGENSRPYVGKIHTKTGIGREKEGLRHAFNFFDDAGQQYFEFIDGKRGIIAIPLIAQIGNKQRVVELHDMLFATKRNWRSGMNGNEWFVHPIESVLAVLDEVYEQKCEKAFANKRQKKCCLGVEYKWYLRGSETDVLLKSWLGGQANRRKVEAYGKDRPNPLKFITALKRAERDLLVSPVHGDLHPSNIVLDAKKSPHLLDFTWCRKSGHILKDFLVMECSIRFLMMPPHLSVQALFELDQCLLTPRDDEAERLVKKLQKLHVDSPTILHIERCVRIISKLRHHARKISASDFSNDDYLATQALVLYGLMRIDRYPFEKCARSLGIICEHLEQHGFDY